MTSRPPSPPARPPEARRLRVFGVVQGVGFRPSVYRLAVRFGFRGWVKNVGRGVEIHVEGDDPGDLDRFPRVLTAELPPLARVERLEVRKAKAQGLRAFRVRRSGAGESFVFISPDISVCEPCRADIRDPKDRRFRYPFTNCTDCGPRYTIVRSLPYDRDRTTMAGFPMCPDCRREYGDPSDRRYHAQPVACPACGPKVSLRDARSGRALEGSVEAAARLVRAGKILAVKGLGGFHLVCDPFHPGAVARLRRTKDRDRKPLALMAKDLAVVRLYARFSDEEKKLLQSPRRPIVLLRKSQDLPGIAPHLAEVGVMLPYTPLHDLLLERLDLVVATSSNPKDAPIIKEDDAALGRLADVVLTHDRPIEMRADDSVAKVVRGKTLFVRRARGYVPYPQRVPEALAVEPHILALGAELKDTISVYKNGYVVTSQFLGDLDDYRNKLYFEETVRHLVNLFAVSPAAVVSDLHPQFQTTRFAEKMGLPHFRVQHHHAHVLAACLEHGLPPEAKVLGISWDGYGYGADGSAWGGEFLLADYEAATRFAHFEPRPLPGGDLAAREPWRMALSYLHALDPSRPPALPAFRGLPPRRLAGVWEMISSGLRSPSSTSCGRLFDAVAALAGVAPLENEFEAEAAMRLEAVAGLDGGVYPFGLHGRPGSPLRLSFLPAVQSIVADVRRGRGASAISAVFHNTLARAAVEVARRARKSAGIEVVVLTGGVFLNRQLLGRTEAALERAGFTVFRPVEYSPNDESISVGQVAYALARLRKGRLRR